MTYILFLIGFVLLIKGADLLVSGASSIAKKFNISNIVIGLTVVSFGTSAPELVVNILASLSGSTEVAIGNVLGSNIANIFLILGVSALIFPLTTKQNTVWKEIPLSLLAVLLLAVMVNDVRIDGASFAGLTRSDGLIFIAFFTIFLYYTFGIAKVTGHGQTDDEIPHMKVSKSLAYVVMGLVGLIFGGKWIVDGAVAIAQAFQVSESLIGLTIVAIGTSLPELATSAIAAKRKEADIAVGNVVGSNIFNVFWILGISSTINPIPFSRTSDIDIAIAITASILLFVTMFVGRRHTLDRWEGGLFVLIYIAYIAYISIIKS